jgi:hypothetical protein
MIIFLLMLLALSAAAATVRLATRRDYSRSVQGFNVALRRLDHVRLTAGGGKSATRRVGAEPSGNVRVVPTSAPARAAKSRPAGPRRPRRARTPS